MLATGFMVGLMEWACIEAIRPHLDWPREQSLGTHVNLSHLAATPPGLEVEITVAVTAVEGRKLTFSVAVGRRSCSTAARVAPTSNVS